MKPVTIDAESVAIDHGTIVLLTGHLDNGLAVAVAVEPRSAGPLLAAARTLGPVTITAEDWQLLHHAS